jgi:hypothetical protein
MAIRSKTTTRWEHEYKSETGVSFTASGVEGGTHVTITVHEPSLGFGMQETPSATASVIIPVSDWNALVKMIDSHG